jgi:hypothetical protein
MDKNKGQIRYFTSVILIFIGFAFFGIFVIQNTPLTGEVITDIDLPESCSDAEIQAVWDSIFWESSSGISILKNDSLVGGKCTEYFANKSSADEANDIYTLYGYTGEVGGANVSYIIAEKINATDSYVTLLGTITGIGDVASLIARDDTFLNTYVELRAETVNSSNNEEIFNETFEMNLSEIWSSEIYLNNLSYSFSDTLSNDTYEEMRGGAISVNYSYAIFSFTSNAIELECEYDDDCDSWSNCFNFTQNRTCVNFSTNCDFNNNTFLDTQSCGIVCVQNWSIGNWSECTDGLQIRNVSDETDCGNITGKPAMNKSCSEVLGTGDEVCTSDWDCDEWNPADCPEDSKQTRICRDKNSCGDSTKSETQSCVSKSESSFGWIFALAILLVIGIIVGLIVFLFKSVKKKEDEEPGVISISQPPIVPAVSKLVPRVPLIKKAVSPVQKFLPSRSLQKPIISAVPKPLPPKLSTPPSTLQPVQPIPKPVPVQTITQKPIKPVIPMKSPLKDTSASIKQALNQIAKPNIFSKPVIKKPLRK